MTSIIGQQTIARRKHWITEIQKLSGNFGADTSKLERELKQEFERL